MHKSSLTQRPFYRDPLNIALIVVFTLIIAFATTVMFYIAQANGGGHDLVPFPREESRIP